MLLKIDVKPEDIIYNKGGRIIVRLKYFSAYADGAHISISDGQTKDDFDGNKARNQKNLFIGQRGGLSLA